MLNKKLCASCVKDYEKKLAGKDEYIAELKGYVNSQAAEIGILENEACKGAMSMMVLKHIPRYNRDKDISNKLKEESLELQGALKFGDHDSIVDEALDVITVCMNAINEQGKYGVDIEFAVGLHQKKLKDRGWEADKIVRFEVING